MMKRIIALLLTLCLLFTGISFSFAEDEDNLTDEELAALEGMGEAEDESDRSVFSRLYNTPGKVYQEKTVKDFNMSSPAIYTGTLSAGKSIYEGTDVDDPNRSPSEQKPTSKKLFSAKNDVTVDILYVGLQWMIVRYEKNIGYVKRSFIPKSTVKALNPKTTPPFNVQKHNWIATTATYCRVRSTMDDTSSENIIYTLNPGTMLSIWQFQDGWAIVNLWKTYCYIDPNELTDLIPVSPTDVPISDESPIAAYTSYYKVPAMAADKDGAETLSNRCWNIRMGCSYISITMQPGDKFDANKLMGPYNRSKQYRIAGTLSNGTTTKGYGGGTCQVSSTLYNAIIQLPGLNITYRRPHGGDGACFYLPCHNDAAVGSDTLNLCFTNNYTFPIRIEGHTSDDGALLMVIYRAD